jgi:hypothetical protein
MKFSLARPALALAIMATLASCGGGGKATFPINVTVSNVLYPGLILSTNGMDHTVDPPATPGQDVTFVFPNQIEYGQTYDVIPQGQVITNGTITALGKQPAHQTCSASLFPKTGTAGQLAKIDIRYVCAVNTYPLTGVVNGLTGDGLVLANGSTASPVSVSAAKDSAGVATGAAVTFAMNSVPYGTTYGVTVLTQPTGQTCTVTGGKNGAGGGTMDDAAETAGGVTSLVVTCVKSS